ncbi:hypothetical protein ACXYMO_00605 [Arenibacterium sp. CAU 1754]
MTLAWEAFKLAQGLQVLTISQIASRATRVGPGIFATGQKTPLAIILDDGQQRTGWTPQGAPVALDHLARQFPEVPITSENWTNSGP